MSLDRHFCLFMQYHCSHFFFFFVWMCLNIAPHNRECVRVSQGQRDLWYDFIWDACRAIYGPVNESCRLSCSDANCTRPLKSSLPSVLVFLPPQQKKKRWTWQKGKQMLYSGRDNNQTSHPTGPKRGEGKEKTNPFSVSPPPLPPFCLTPSYPLWNRSYPQMPLWQGQKKELLPFCTFNASYTSQYNRITTVNHYVMYKVYWHSLYYIR